MGDDQMGWEEFMVLVRSVDWGEELTGNSVDFHISQGSQVSGISLCSVSVCESDQLLNE